MSNRTHCKCGKRAMIAKDHARGLYSVYCEGIFCREQTAWLPDKQAALDAWNAMQEAAGRETKE